MPPAEKKYISVILLVLILAGLASFGAAQETYHEQKKYDAWLAKRPVISDIVIEGNDYFSDSKIISNLYSQEDSFWHSFKSGSRNRVLRYSPIRDTMEVKYMYLLEGFLDIRIDETFEIIPEDSSARLMMTIEEGPRYLVDSVVLEASESLPFYGALRRTLNDIKIGEAVNPIQIKEVVFDLKTIYANNGYPYATIEEDIEPMGSPARTKLTFTGEEGLQVRFGNLIIGDLNTYSPHLARREVVFEKGQLYSRKKILESQKRLYATNLFNSVSLDISRGDTADGDSAGMLNTSPDFIFSAIERKPHFVSVKTGASQDSLQDLTWDFSSAWGKRNIFVSRRIELSLKFRFIIFTQWRTLYHRYQVKFTEPWFFNVPMPLTVTARFEPGVRSPVQRYRIETWSLALSTRKEWSENLYAIATGRYENVNVYGIAPEDQLQFRSQQGISIRRKIDFTLIRDTRRDKFMPRSGSFTTYFGQYAGGFLQGDDSFVKLEFSWARYQLAIGNAVYATRFKAGWVKEFGRSHEVPFDDRFYLGGANSIRGFEEKSIGPRNESGTNVGANTYAIFNQELRFPLFWKFWGSIFADLGNGWETFSDVEPGNVLFSFGGGIQFISPAGPIRLDYGYHFENEVYKEDDRFHFTILYAF